MNEILDFAIAYDWTRVFVGIFLIVVLALIAHAIRAFNQVPTDDRPAPIRAADELGSEDWRELVTDFFTESFIRHTRRRLAVFSVTGADPERTGSAPVGRPDPVTRTGSESSYASTEQ